jgi:tetratricopeptide (TPR) repeat protein
MIGWVYLDLNADDDAERWFRHGMSKGPENALPRLGLADVFHARDQHDEEFRLLDIPVDELTLEGTARERICGHMLDDGRYEEFLAECATFRDHGLLTDEPDNLAIYWIDLNRARALWHLGRVGEAEAIWIELEERFVSSAPKDAGHWQIFLALLYADQGQIERAVDELQEAADSGWRFFWQGFFRQIFDDGNDPQAKFWSDPRVVAMGEEIARDVARQLRNVREMEQAGEIVPLGLEETHLKD